jgi:hypothetical protein
MLVYNTATRGRSSVLYSSSSIPPWFVGPARAGDQPEWVDPNWDLVHKTRRDQSDEWSVQSGAGLCPALYSVIIHFPMC